MEAVATALVVAFAMRIGLATIVQLQTVLVLLTAIITDFAKRLAQASHAFATIFILELLVRRK
jgi:hypothetical protein